MKKLHIILIALLSALIVFLCGVIGFFLTGGAGRGMYFHRDTGNYSLALEERVPAEDIRSLRVLYDGTVNDVRFYQSAEDDIIIREYMSAEPDEQRISTVEKKDGELIIKGWRKNFFFFFSFYTFDAYTEIYLPADFSQGLERLQVKTVSGNIMSEIPLYIAGDFAASTTSGDILLPDVEAEEVALSSTSGEISLAQTIGGQISASTVSGDIRLEQAAGDMKLSTTSGNIFLTGLEGGLSASTTSGDISLGQVSEHVSLSTTSGSVRLESGMNGLEAESVSGDIRVGSLNGSFRMNTTSGILAIAAGSGYGTASSVSGDISLFLEELKGNLDISTTSGMVDLAFPEDAAFSFRFGSTSGECRTFFDEALSFNKKGNKAEGQYGHGGGAVEVSTTSGDLLVTEYR